VRGKLRLVGAAAVAAVAVTSTFVGSSPGANPPAASTVSTDCSKATATQLVNQYRLNNFLLQDPVQQLLCGPFTGPSSQAMAVTIKAATCWSPQSWAVFRLTGSDWQLVMVQNAFIFPLVAVGADIRETAPVFRSGDPRCVPSGGRHARVWHWDGSQLVAGAWKRTTQGAAVTAARFFTPSGNIACEMVDHGIYRDVACIMQSPPAIVRLAASGLVRICQHQGLKCSGNLGDSPGIPNGKLAYGASKRVGRFRCSSAITGVTCVVTATGKGFFVSKRSVKRVG
jgi:hypothetical protein